MQLFIFASALIGGIALLLFVRGLRRIYKRRLLSGISMELSAVTFLAIAAVFFLLASNLYTYQRLTYERPVAEVAFIRVQPQLYRVNVTQLETGEAWQLDVMGDEWQLDAQVLTWKGIASLLGLDASYRLHRFSGRYQDIDQARKSPQSVYSLVSPRRLDTGIVGEWEVEAWTLDIWEFVRKHAQRFDMVDAVYGSAVFLPMIEDARYIVSISRTGLIARPDNSEAREAVSDWVGL